MSEQSKENWQQAFDIFLERAHKKISKAEIDWAIIGSVASYLQGCKITPNDLDILVKNPENVGIIIDFLKEYYLKENSEKTTIQDESGEKLWLSSEERPVDISKDEWDFTWTFARVLIKGIKVEIAHIEAPKDHFLLTNGIWEAGPKIWSHINQMSYHGYSIPVVPLEIQLGTNISRVFQERIDAIIAVFKKEGYNEKLLNKALTIEQMAQINGKLSKIK